MEDTRKKITEKVILNYWTYIIISALFFGFSISAFWWGKDVKLWKADFIIDSGYVGTFGDFVGGTLGTLFAIANILLLIKTFREQRKVTIENNVLVEKQRFNDLFFELLHLYQSEVNELSEVVMLPEENDSHIVYRNKDFFEYHKKQLQQQFAYTTSFEKNQKEALLLYLEFYHKHKDWIGACFRTLYRIYDLIDKSPLDNVAKREYLKIIRAQLTTGELFFLRYDAMSFYGKKFVKYINKYRVLKHLQAFDLLELKDFRKDMTEAEVAGINNLFSKANDVMTKIQYKAGKAPYRIQLSRDPKYKIVISSIAGTDIEIIITIDSSKNVEFPELKGLEKMDAKRLQALIDCYLKESFIYSNFNEFNNNKELYFASDKPFTKKTITTINSRVESRNKRLLQIKNIIEYGDSTNS